jgi:histidine ammonia-lyase
MMAQVTAAALVNENKVLSHPASVDSITTSGNKEDFVSMGMTSANKLLRVLTNTRNVLAIEALAAAQALDFRAPLETGKRAKSAVAAIRAVSPRFTEDRIFTPDIVRVSDLIASGKLAEALR